MILRRLRGILNPVIGRLAQLVRALRLHRRCRRFEPAIAHQPSRIRQDPLPDFFTAGQAVRDQRRIDKTETGKAREDCPAVALAEADQPIGG